jgi:hypothetical protein
MDRLRFHLHSIPERYVVFNFFGGGTWRGVKPGGMGMAIAIHYHILITGGSCPRTNGVSIARPPIFPLDGSGREILIPSITIV